MYFVSAFATGMTLGTPFYDPHDNLLLIEPVVTTGANTVDTFSFTMTADHPDYSNVLVDQTWFMVWKSKEDYLNYDEGTGDVPVFVGKATSDEFDFYKNRHVVCTSFFDIFNKVPTMLKKYDSNLKRNLALNYMMSDFNDIVTSNNSDYLENGLYKIDTVGLSKAPAALFTEDSDFYTLETQSYMDALKEQFVDVFGGYFFTRLVKRNDKPKYGFDLVYVSEEYATSTQNIEYGVNLLDLNINYDADNLITCVYPVGAPINEYEGTVQKRLTLTPNPNLSINEFGVLIDDGLVSLHGWKCATLDYEKVNNEEKLYNKAVKVLQNNKYQNMSINISAVDLSITDSSLDMFKVLNKVKVISSAHGLNDYFLITERTYNLSDPASDVVTLGIDNAATISGSSTQINNATLRVLKQNSATGSGGGSSSIAQKAIADQNGNVIDETYATKEEAQEVIDGFYDSESGKFYSDYEMTTEINGEPDKLYIDKKLIPGEDYEVYKFYINTEKLFMNLKKSGNNIVNGYTSTVLNEKIYFTVKNNQLTESDYVYICVYKNLTKKNHSDPKDLRLTDVDIKAMICTEETVDNKKVIVADYSEARTYDIDVTQRGTQKYYRYSKKSSYTGGTLIDNVTIDGTTYYRFLRDDDIYTVNRTDTVRGVYEFGMNYIPSPVPATEDEIVYIFEREPSSDEDKIESCFCIATSYFTVTTNPSDLHDYEVFEIEPDEYNYNAMHYNEVAGGFKYINYYTKDETYSKDEVDEIIESIPKSTNFYIEGDVLYCSGDCYISGDTVYFGAFNS